MLQSLVERDAVRECLEKDPQERTDDDIEILLEYMQHFPVSAQIWRSHLDIEQNIEIKNNNWFYQCLNWSRSFRHYTIKFY